MNAILYCRFSPRPNAAECDSIATQLDRLRAWCLAMSMTILAEYDDADLSGSTTDGRPALEDAIRHAIRARAVLCVYSLSRLCRNTRDAIDIAERLDKGHADLASLHERIDTSSPMGRFFFRMVASLAELEREQIVERTSDAMQRHQYQGGRRMTRVDRCPWGWRAVNGSGLLPDEAERAIAQRIIALHKEGYNNRAIARRLDAEGIERRGKKWVGAAGMIGVIIQRNEN